MKKTTYLKTLLVAVCLLGGASFAWGVEVPEPVYLQNFNDANAVSDFGGTIVGGQGQLVSSTDDRFGKYYQNMPNASAATQRTNYLKIVPATNPWSALNTAITSGETPTNAFTISMWVNTKIGNSHNIDGYWSPLMIACKDNEGTIPQHPFGPQLLAFGGIHINSNGYVDYQLEGSSAGTDIYTNGLATSGWHHIVWVFSNLNTTSFGYSIYVDGVSKLSTNLTFNGTSALGMLNDLNCIVLGSTASAAYWDWNDNAFAYDDIAIYPEALSDKQIGQIISNKLHYTVNAVDGSSKILKVLADANSSANSVSYAYPRYINVDGTLYTKAAGTGTNHYQGSLTLTSGNQIESVPYTASSYLSVLYFKEAEDVLSSTTSGGAGSRCSNMAGGYASSATKITTLPAGTYTIYFGAYASSSTHLYFYKNSESGGIIKDYTGSGSWQEANTGKFTLDKATDILVKGGTSGGYVFDYFIITGDIVGATDCSTDYLGEMTDKVTLYPGQSWHYKFINHNGLSSNNYKNYVVPVYNASDERKITVRADNWEDQHNIGSSWGSNAGCSSNFNWTNWISNMNGATVDMTVTFTSEKVFNMSAKITAADKSEWTYSYTNDYTDSPIDLTSSAYIKVALSVSSSWLEVVESWPTTVSKTISDAGWATYCSPYALDFTSSIANLTKAYLVTGNTGASLTLSPITGTIPANTGILLEGEGDVTIPVVASSTTNVSANKLEGVTTATEKKAESIYVLMASPKVGFYKNTNAFTVGANTAYLPDGFGTGYARSFFSFDDEETTSVNELKTTNFTNNTNEVFDLQGRRVAQPTKGLYIVNGKKVVIK